MKRRWRNTSSNSDKSSRSGGRAARTGRWYTAGLGSSSAAALETRSVLTARVFGLALLLGAEAIVASIYLDGETLVRQQGVLVLVLRGWGAWAVRCAIACAALFATFAYLTSKPALAQLAGSLARTPVNRRLLAAHFLAIGLFAGFAAALFRPGLVSAAPDLLAGGFFLTGLAAMISAALAAAPRPIWMQLVRSTGRLWLYASAAAVAACSAGALSRSLWLPASKLTFTMVRLMLSLAVRDLVIQPERLRLGTHRFTAIVSPECSGLEGAALLLIFGVLWLWLCRRECRFPQALLLLPAALVVLFVLNAVRIAALVLIGHAGAREIALRGFHSQAGWIAFNLVAFGFSLAARRLPWFAVRTPESLPQAGENPAAAYLVPFLAILAAGMISRAASARFEWLYGLRFAAALGALWIFRRSYGALGRPRGWLGPLAGAGVFLLWIAEDLHSAVGGMPAVLASAPPALRWGWIGLRVLAAAVTVPIAEELAFRGFLLRRFISADFEAVSFHRFTWLALLASSLIFGLMHGSRWLAGSAAGAAYAAVSLRTGRLADAIVAHAVTNALLAAYVLGFGQWQFW